MSTPEPGTIAQGRHLGYKSANRYIWALCPKCAQGRWVILTRYKADALCKQCAATRAREAPPGLPVTSRNKLGLKGTSRMVKAPCPTCGVERWTLLKTYTPELECQSCVGKRNIRKAQAVPKRLPSHCGPGPQNAAWKGGRTRTKQGYITVWLPPDDPLRAMAHADGYVLEHRLVVARALGRTLAPYEYVHHLNGDRADNREENLELWKRAQPSGIRQRDYHCPGCRCEEIQDEQQSTDPDRARDGPSVQPR